MQKDWDVAALTELKRSFEQLPTTGFMIIEGGTIIDSYGDMRRSYPLRQMNLMVLSALYGRLDMESDIPLHMTLGALAIQETPELTPYENKLTLQDLFQSRHAIRRPAAGELTDFREKQELPAYPHLTWHFNQWGFNVLGSLYEKVSDERMLISFDKHFAEPLQFQDFRALRHGSEVFSPLSDHMAVDFSLSMRDFARLALLFLNEGRWGDQQLISRGWVQESTMVKSTGVTSVVDGSDAGGFGWLWWTSANHKLFPGVEMPNGSYALHGEGGQYVAIIPSMELIVIHFNNTPQEELFLKPEQFGEILNTVIQAKNPLIPRRKEYSNPRPNDS